MHRWEEGASMLCFDVYELDMPTTMVRERMKGGKVKLSST